MIDRRTDFWFASSQSADVSSAHSLYVGDITCTLRPSDLTQRTFRTPCVAGGRGEGENEPFCDDTEALGDLG